MVAIVEGNLFNADVLLRGLKDNRVLLMGIAICCILIFPCLLLDI